MMMGIACLAAGDRLGDAANYKGTESVIGSKEGVEQQLEKTGVETANHEGTESVLSSTEWVEQVKLICSNEYLQSSANSLRNGRCCSILGNVNAYIQDMGTWM